MEKKIRYLLAGLERQTVAKDGTTLSDELTPHAVTVEHIFPRSPSDKWKAIAAADPDWDNRMISRMGNLCLLPGVNQALGNKLFEEKAKAYKKSRLHITRELADSTSWGRVQIAERQARMANTAVSAWRFQ